MNKIKLLDMTKTKLNIINVIIFGLLFCIVLSGGQMISKLESLKDEVLLTAETTWREQSKAHIEHTVNLLEKDIEDGYVSPFNTNSITKWVENNFINSSNVSVHSNTIVNELETGEMISGSSVPLFIIEGDEYDPVTRVISDKQKDIGDNSLKKVINLIQSGKPPGHSDKLSYTFNGYTEWVEYNYYPPRGVLIEPDNDLRKRFVFVVSVREDTILELCKYNIMKYDNIIKIIYVSLVLLFLLGVFIATMLLCNYYDSKFSMISESRRNIK